MEWMNGIKTMGHGGVTKHGCKQLKCGMTTGVTGMRVGQLTGLTDSGTEDWAWTGQESQQEYASSSQRPENSEIQSLVLSPLIGRIFGEISIGLFLQAEMDELGSSNSNSSWGDGVCVVSASGLSCPFDLGPPILPM